MAADTTLDDIGYAAAMAELGTILAELESDTVDVDRLGERVRRAAQLIALCRARIADAQLSVETVLAELEPRDED
jgi:exodeoxyribonuclease VII small subunit